MGAVVTAVERDGPRRPPGKWVHGVVGADAGSGGDGWERGLAGTVQAFGHGQEEGGVVHLPQARQEASTEPCEFQKGSPPQPGRWCQLVWARCHPAPPQLGKRSQGCPGTRELGGAGEGSDLQGVTLLHHAYKDVREVAISILGLCCHDLKGFLAGLRNGSTWKGCGSISL